MKRIFSNKIIFASISIASLLGLYLNIILADPKIWQFIHKLNFLFDGKVLDSKIFTYKMLDKLIYRDAMIIAINNMFIYIATLFICSLIIVYFAKERSENE